MAKQTVKELFEELKVKYLEAYENLYGKDKAEQILSEIKYKKGYVYFPSGTTVRVNDLIAMTETLNYRAYRAIIAKKEIAAEIAAKKEEEEENIFSQEELVASPQFKTFIGDDTVALIHNPYHNSKVPYQAYIVIHHGECLPIRPMKYSITRFFKMRGKIQVSQDHFNISDKEVFSILLSQYSRGLK